MSFMSVNRGPNVTFTSDGKLILKCEITRNDLKGALEILGERASIFGAVGGSVYEYRNGKSPVKAVRVPLFNYSNVLLMSGINNEKNTNSFVPTVDSVSVYEMNGGSVAEMLLRVGSQVDTIWLMNRAPLGSKLVCRYTGQRVDLDRKSGGWFFGDGKKACKASFGINDAEFAWIVATAERMQSPVLG